MSNTFPLLFIIGQFVLGHYANAAEARQLSDGHGSFFEVPLDLGIVAEQSGLSESEQECSATKSCRKAAFGNVTFSIDPSRGWVCLSSQQSQGLSLLLLLDIDNSYDAGLSPGDVVGESCRGSGMRQCTSTGMMQPAY